MRTNRLQLSVLALVPFLFYASPARADGGARETYAEQLFQDGVQLMKDDKCPQAVPKFLHSQQLDPSAGTLANLATCYVRLGRTASAWRAYRQALEAADKENDQEVRQRVLKAISILDPRLTKLRLISSRATVPLSITLNGEPLAPDEAFPVPLDPGENVIEAVAPGRKPWRHKVDASEQGATIVIEVPELPVAREPKAQPDYRRAAVVVVGLGAAALAVGSVLGLSARSDYDESGRYCRYDHCNATGHDLRIMALDKASASSWTMGLGAVAAATGIVLWFASPRAKEGVGLSPWAGAEARAVGVSLEARQ